MPINEQSAWVGEIRQLYNRLQDNDDRFNLLRQIDQTMTDFDLSMGEFLSRPLTEFARLSQASNAYLYVDSGDELLLLCVTNSDEAEKSIMVSALSPILPLDQKDSKVITKDELGQIGPLFPDATCLYLLPIWLPSDKAWPSSDQRFGVVILKDTRYDHHLTPFQEQAIQSFAQAVIDQLSIGIRFQLKGWRSLWFEKLMDAFFNLDLDPDDCFKELAQKIPEYLPRFGPFQFESPDISIIIHRADTEHLTIIAGTAQGQTGVRLKFNDSVTGLLFENPDLEYILGNPRQDSQLESRYKAYAAEINTELVAPIKRRSSKTPIAVINLESKSHHAFKQLHVDALLHLCNILTPVITALYIRVVEIRTQQQAVLYAQRSYWNTIGAVLRHNTNSQLASIRMGIDNVTEAIKLNKPEEQVNEILTPVQSNLEAVSEEIKEFSDKMHEYTVYGCYSVKDQILEAITKTKQRMQQNEPRIQINYVQDEDFYVFCSPIFAMHLYNVLDNSVYWIGEWATKDPGHRGEISISVKPGPLPAEDQEQELNQTCEITIFDNGAGCSPDILERLLRRPVTSQRTGLAGMGHAVYATAGYVKSLGGTIEVDSKKGEWFKIVMYLPLYNETLHKPTSVIEVQV